MNNIAVFSYEKDVLLLLELVRDLQNPHCLLLQTNTDVFSVAWYTNTSAHIYLNQYRLSWHLVIINLKLDIWAYGTHRTDLLE